MRTYNEKTGELIENPDLSAGYTYPGRRLTGTELQVLPGTVTATRPEGLRREVPIYEDCLFFHPWGPGEKPEENPQPPDPEPPDPADGVATWDELAAAYTEGVGLA